MHREPQPATAAAPWDQRIEQLKDARDWQLGGRAAVALGQQGWQASLDWRQRGADSDIHLAGPLGVGALEIKVTPAGLSLNGAPPSDAMIGQLQERLGFELPLDNLRYWLLGIPDPGMTFELTRNPQDRAQHLSQAGWTIDYDRYLPANGDLLPATTGAQPRRMCACASRSIIGQDSVSAAPAARARQSWPAPAKLNLFLHIVGRRAGRLSRAADLLPIRRSVRRHPPRGARRRRHPPVAGRRRASRRRTICACAPRGRCRRRPAARSAPTSAWSSASPWARGLGGGSSDAATCLVALNQLWGLGPAASRAGGARTEIGRRCAGFVQGRVAWAEGVGERFTPLYAAAGAARVLTT